MRRARWVSLVLLSTSIAATGCVTTVDGTADDQEQIGDEDYIGDLADSDDPGLDDAYDFEAAYTLSEGIAPLRQLDYPGVRLFDGHACSRTISSSGCAVASHAMLMDYYGQPSTLPEHSSSLHGGRPHGHSGCQLVWNGSLAPGVTYRGVGSSSLSSIRRELDEGSPVIAHVAKAGRSRCHHFVLVTGYSNDGTSRADFEIMDPATGTRRNLSVYARICSTRLFDGTPAPDLY